MYKQYFQSMPDDELSSAITAFLEYAEKYRVRRDPDGERRMMRLVKLARDEVTRRQGE